ncbi:hypothetical protein DFH11DRAFT_1515346, partial [Phellopilus nigrolimitatus]
LSHSEISFDVSAVPDEVWTEIALFFGLIEVLCLELTCKFFRNIFISDRVFWLRRLHALEQDEAPNLPRHIPISTLTLPKLRSLVIRAHRRYLKYTGPAQLRLPREIKKNLWNLNRQSCHTSLSHKKLLPGGELFLSACLKELQCFKVLDGKCIWAHRPDEHALKDEHALDPSDKTRKYPKPDEYTVQNFGYDMQANGDVRVLVVGTSPSNSNDNTM